MQLSTVNIRNWKFNRSYLAFIWSWQNSTFIDTNFMNVACFIVFFPSSSLSPFFSLFLLFSDHMVCYNMICSLCSLFFNFNSALNFLNLLNARVKSLLLGYSMFSLRITIIIVKWYVTRERENIRQLAINLIDWLNN